MPQAWIVECPPEKLSPDKVYFLARRWVTCGSKHYDFYLEWGNGTNKWGGKPSIAVRFRGNDAFKKILSQQKDFVALEVPADADKRWKARTRPKFNPFKNRRK